MAGEVLAGLEAGHDEPGHELAGTAVLPPVVDEEILEREAAHLVAPAQLELRPEGDEGRRGVSDRGAVGDVAADAPRGTDLLRAEPAQHLRNVGVDCAERRFGIGVAHRGAEDERCALPLDAEQLPYPSEVDDLRQAPQLLGNPQRHVGRSGDQGGAGMAQVEIGQRCRTARCGEETLFVADEDIFLGVDGREGGRAARGAPRERVVRAAGTGCEGGIRNGAVAGAAAEIARQPVVDLRTVRLMSGVVEREQAHHESRGAEPALRAVMLDQGRLHGMQGLAGGAQVLDGDQLPAVHHSKEVDAGVYRLVADLVSVAAPEHHGAGAAVAFRAAFLGAHGPFAQTQVLEQRLVGTHVAKLDDFAAAKETDARARHGCRPPLSFPDMSSSRRGTGAAARGRKTRRRRSRSEPGPRRERVGR